MLASSTLLPISTEEIFSSGRRRPLLVRCREVDDASRISYTSAVVKTKADDFPPERALVEAIASVWASAVSIRTPRCWPLEISEAQAEVLSLPTRQVKPGLAFASEYLPNAIQVAIDNPVTNTEGTAILAFDAAIQNTDRSKHNSNCLLVDQRPYVIDHEAALDFFVDLDTADTNFGVDFVLAEHVFLPRLKAFLHQDEALDAICAKIASVSSEQIAKLADTAFVSFAKPVGWKELAAHLLRLKQNVLISVKTLALIAAR